MSPANAGVITGEGTCEICIQWAPGFFGKVTLQVNYQNVLTGSGCSLFGNCSHDPGCGGTGTISVLVKPIFGISGPSRVCPNTTSAPFNGMNLTNNTIAPGVSWKLKTPIPSTINFSSSALLNTYTWNAGPGIYTLTAYAPAGVYCNDSATVNVQVVDMKIPNPITGLDTVCAGDTTFYSTAPNMTGVIYNWIVSNGTIIGNATGSSVAVKWNAGGGTITVSQSLAASPFCSSPSVSFVVKTWPVFPLPTITPGATVACVKSTITYSIPPTLLNNATYTWSVVPSTAGNITTANGTNTITIHWINASITPIYVKLKISRCYTDSVMLLVNLLALPPVPNISYAPLNPCKNTVVNFSTTSPGTWNWSFGDAGTSTSQNPPHTYLTAGDFNVRLYVTNANGCSDTAKTTIHVEDIPVVPVITGPSNVCVNSPTSHFFSQPLFQGASYTWSLSAPPKGGITSSSNTAINVLWSIPGIDTIKLHVQSTCLDTVIRFVVTVHPTPSPGITLPSPACEGAPLTFNGSGGPNYFWTFSGGSIASSVLQSPVVTYAVAGVYPLSLSVTDVFGCTASINSSITIHPLPLAVITGPFSICSFPASVTMSAINIGGNTYVWTPGGATTPSITQNINAATTFSVVVTNGFMCSRTSNSITVDTSHCPPPDTSGCTVTDTINFTHTPPVCLSVTFTKTGNATLTGWNFGDGGSDTAISPVTHTYPYPGNYLVEVQGTAMGIDNNGLPCNKIVKKQHLVTVPFDAKFDVTFQCNGSNQMQTIFTNTSLYLGNAASYNWTWYDVSTASTLSTAAFPPPQLLTAGTHTISLYIFDPVTLATCTLSHVIVVPVPIAASFMVSTPVCQGSPSVFTDNSVTLVNEVSRLFNNGNSATSTLSPCSLVYINSGSFIATLTVSDKYGCTSTATKPITVNPAATGTITVTPACDSVQLFSSGAGPFTWNVIVPPPSPTNPVYVKTSGFYSVTSVDGNGCPFTVGPVQVTVNKSPNATITGQTQYCQGENLDIKTLAAGTMYVWKLIVPNVGVVGGNTPNLTVPAGQGNAGTYTYQVTVTGLNNCVAVATYVINVASVPSNASIVGGPLTLCQGDSVLLTVSPPGATYLWSKSPAPPLSSPANTNNFLYASVTGIYSVIVKTASGCPYPAIATVNITVNPTPTAQISGDTVLCEGDTLILKTISVGGATYAWTGPFASGNTNPFIKTNIQLSDSGYYKVVVTNTFGCTASDSVYVVVHPTPATPVIAPPGPFCEGTLHTLCVQAPPYPFNFYHWSTGQTGYCINAVKAGHYYTVVTNQFGCSAKSNVVIIHPLPDLSCVPTGCYDFCNECDSVTIPGPFNLTTYDWQKLVGGIFQSYSNTQNLIVLPPGGIFRLIGYNQWGCSDSTDTLKVDFHDCCSPIDSTICIDTCLNFNDGQLIGWQPHPSAPNVGLIVSNVLSQGGPTDYYLRVSDQPGPSQLLAGSQFNGHWCCGTFCYDYRLFNDGVAGTVNVNPVFTIFNGTLGFRFTSSVIANETNGWHRICAPVSDCGFPGTSASGSWTPIAGTVVADWSTVINYITALVFKVDYTTSDVEVSGFDNPCLTPNFPVINAGADQTICQGGVAILHVEGCTSIPTWYALNGGENFFIGNGGVIDVSPTVTTCYMVICCNEGTACCCDTDTVCVIVRPLPVISWPVNYPNVCLNADSVYLDSLSINVSPTGGTGVFSGVGVIGNYFHPNTLGAHTITYCYTDTNGCTACVSKIINVIFCCANACHIDAGPDQTICAGGVAILHVTGCDSIARWYALGGDANVFVGQGEILDVLPQQTTCYMVICCCAGTSCCDTDTVCVFVNPLPHLTWPISYNSVCLNGDSIFLNAANIFVTINNTQIPITSTGGTWTWSGNGVVGNYFYPTSLGNHVITLCYTDPNGCTACVSNTINVIYCCGNSCHVNAGNDATICAGNSYALNAQGCNGSLTWYVLTAEGPVVIGQEPEIGVTPGQSTCYMVVCCCTDPIYPGVVCCDTDTVCIVVKPLPHLYWALSYNSVCLNAAPVFLDANNIFVTINNNQVPITSTGGTWTWSGAGVIGNYFYPTSLGNHVITLCYTDPNGCTACVSNTINVIYCCGNSCQVNAGNDATICAGNSYALNAQGCNGSLTWYVLTAEGPVVIGQEPEIGVTPAQSTCYMAICCCNDPIYPGNVCCDTDTVCITVRPLPHLYWAISYASVCLNAPAIYLDANNIFVTINNNQVPITSTGGTWTWSGAGVLGNYFYPTSLGNHVITLCYTDPNGCTACVSNSINVIQCGCDTVCQNFNNNQLNGWQADPNAPNVIVGTNNVGSQNGPGDYYLQTIDQSGASALMAPTAFNHWCCGELCYDWRIFNDGDPGSSYNVPAVVWVYSGNLGFGFTSSVIANENNGWRHVCIPVSTCDRAPDSSSEGYWQPLGNTVAGDWNTVTTNITRVVFRSDYSSFTGERSGFDNICFTPTTHGSVNAGPDQTICAGTSANLNVEGCHGSATWYALSNDFPVVVGHGQTIHVTPVQTTCYMVICGSSCCSDTDTVCVTIKHIGCPVIIHVKVLIQGYYIGNGHMASVLVNQEVPGSTEELSDTLIIELHHASDFSLVDSYRGVADIYGNITCSFNASTLNSMYYIAVRHRNAVFTTSADPVLISDGTLYDFTTSPGKAYGDNQTDNYGDGYWEIYSGDVNQDEYVGTDDVTIVDNDNLTNGGIAVGYDSNDFNGDGYVGTDDVTNTDNNNLNGVFSLHP